MKKVIFSVFHMLIISLIISGVCYSGTAPIKVIHVNPDQKAVKFIFRYGYDKKENPSEYTNYTIVIPETPALGETICNVKFEGAGVFYVSVKDYYFDGSESEYCEPFQIKTVPDKTKNLKINN